MYALGAAPYFLLGGAPVFEGRNVVEVCCQHLHSAPARLGGKISEELERVVLDCLAKDPAARPASATGGRLWTWGVCCRSVTLLSPALFSVGCTPLESRSENTR